MDNKEESFFTSRIFSLGHFDTLRSHIEWLRLYYKHKEMDIKNLRQDVLNYSILNYRLEFISQSPFRTLLMWYSWDMWRLHCEEMCQVVNDNDPTSVICSNEKTYNFALMDWDRIQYPTIKWNPMTFFTAKGSTRFGKIFKGDVKGQNILEYLSSKK